MSFPLYALLVMTLVGVGVTADHDNLSKQLSGELLSNTQSSTLEEAATGAGRTQEDVVLNNLDTIIRDLCAGASTTSDACLELENIEKHLAALAGKAMELRVKVLLDMSLSKEGLVRKQQEKAKRGRPLSVDAPMRSVSEKVHRQQVRMSLELLRKLGRRR